MRNCQIDKIDSSSDTEEEKNQEYSFTRIIKKTQVSMRVKVQVEKFCTNCQSNDVTEIALNGMIVRQF